MKKNIFLAFIVICLSWSTAFASTSILDTGIPDGINHMFDQHQGVAVKFELGSTYTINEIYSFFVATPGNLTLAIYGNGGDIPNTNNELFSNIFQLDGDGTYRDWFGLGGINLTLDPGFYWAAFEYRPNNYYTYDGGVVLDAPYPAIEGAYIKWPPPSFEDWPEYINYNDMIGARIIGDPVPLPGAFWLLGSGLAGLIAVYRRRK